MLKTTTQKMVLNDVIKYYGRSYIFDFDYPMIAGHREAFEEKFIDTYYFHRIGFDTVDMFRQRLKSHLNNVMPLFIQRYKSCGLIGNPFENYNVRESTHRTNDRSIFEATINEAIAKQLDKGTKHDRSIRHEDIVGYVDIDTTEDWTRKQAEHEDRITDTTEDKDRVTTYTGNEQARDGAWTEANGKYFSDTPQANFVTSSGHYNGDIWVPDSSYATTVTTENTEHKGTGAGNVDTTYTENQDTDTITHEVMSDDKTDNETKGTVGTSANKHGDTTDNDDVHFTETGNDTIKSTTGLERSDSNAIEVESRDKDYFGLVMVNTSKVLKEFRTTFINVDLEVINSCNKLFMLVWD